MSPLPSDLRKTLENAVIAARRAAEQAAAAALTTLAVARPEPFASMDAGQRQLRRALRAKARQLGDDLQAGELPLLRHEIAYEQWHRMLFARFLAENDLLMHPEMGVPVSLAECAELAPEEGATDAWDLAARYASAMLPGIFPVDDPAVQVRFAPEGRQKLEAILAGLPAGVFTADDGLGWVYQFWQTEKKKEVNASGRKIGGADLAPVTQLFTEDYMVKFLLHNSLGAWWAARHPESPLVKEMEYLRWMEGEEDGGRRTEDGRQRTEDGGQRTEDGGPQTGDGGEGTDHVTRYPLPATRHPLPVTRTPAAGTFPGWPDRAAEVTMMDPCGGSGHFVLAGFELLRRMRIEEEGLSEAAAADAVIRDNLFMLELDSRCTQIATFGLALAAWKAGGYRDLPTPHIACSGIAVTGQLQDWLRLARGDERLVTALERLYRLFKDAPTLGSLINPSDVPLNERMFSAEYEEVAPLLERALAKERDDPAAAVLGAAAEGMAKAARLLASRYSLIVTNVPYLARNRQDERLRCFCDQHHHETKGDLAVALIERCRALCQPGGSYCIVSPQSWRFLGAYKRFRQEMLREQTWNIFTPLGVGAFDSIGGEVVNVALGVFTASRPIAGHAICIFDVSHDMSPSTKAAHLQSCQLRLVPQRDQLETPDARITLDRVAKQRLLKAYAESRYGLRTGDFMRFGRKFWEICHLGDNWSYLQSTVLATMPFGGREHIFFWNNGRGPIKEYAELGVASIQGAEAWKKHGVVISLMTCLPCTLYTGEIFDNNVAVIWPQDSANLPAIWAFCQSPEFAEFVRKIDQSLKVTNQTLLKVPFDLIRWQTVANESDPLPGPFSNDPTQWLFGGYPTGATEPLQVAVARLLGYGWPQQTEDNLGAHADADGIVCLPAVNGERPAAERLRDLLAAAYGGSWSAAEQERVLAAVGFVGKTLGDWLRDGFFAQHCRLFHNRPFIWHVWDGRKDGFSALINYHRLDRPTLEKLIYTYLGGWITRQRQERDAGTPGADGRLVAALELQKKLIVILEGEPPHDIYVRWKPLARQPIGWEPDLNDGVRLNIRPFVTAGVLRSKFTINWNKDRGTNPDGSERINDRHLTRAEKEAARKEAG